MLNKAAEGGTPLWAQGIEAEILLRSKRLERIARFFAVPPQKMR
jgi:hypothetical protein